MTSAQEEDARALVQIVKDNPRQNHKWYMAQLGMTPSTFRTARRHAEMLGDAVVHEQKGHRHRLMHGSTATGAVIEAELKRSSRSLLSSTKTHNVKCDSRNRKDMRLAAMTEDELRKKLTEAVMQSATDAIASVLQ